MIPINKPWLDAEEKTEIIQVLEDNVLTSAARDSGKGVQDFETELRKFLKVKHVSSCYSGTSALYAALIATDIKKGDEILVPSFTFVASTKFILAMGAKPIFVDINLNPVTVCYSPIILLLLSSNNNRVSRKYLSNATSGRLIYDIY
jgi:perosamine synthetase